MVRRRRGSRRLGDIAIGKQTAKVQAIRDGIKGMRKALDRGACRDAAAIGRLTALALGTVGPLPNERRQFEAEQDRLARCRR